MGRVALTRKARQDLVAIWEYIAQDDPGTADHVLGVIEEKGALLASAPGIGRKRPEIAPELRSLSVWKYIILYREIPKGIEVVRVLHGARDISTLFQPGD